jgi:hypothetical protein
MSAVPEPELQKTLDTFHNAKIRELVEGLKKLQG